MPNGIDGTLASELGIAREDLSTIVTHLSLVVGIVFFEWNVVELILVYLVEVAVTGVLCMSAAMFAAQPIADRDADKWRREPTPIRIAPFLPPIYKRNLGLVARELLNGGVFFAFFAGIAVSLLDRSVSSLLSPTVGLAILAVCVSQLVRVRRQFFADQSYRERSPAEAIRAGLRPIARLTVIALYVVTPLTFVLGITAIALSNAGSLSAVPHARAIVLLAYVLPIGAASVWLQNDRFEVGLRHRG